MPLALSVVGAPALADRLRGVRLDGPARMVVIGGPVRERAQRAAEALSDGAHVLLLWPPAAAAAEGVALASRAEEAGVEIGVLRPLGARVLAGVPEGWAARLVTLTLVARTGGPLAGLGWNRLLAGAADLCASLADARDASRLDAVAERDGDALRAVALAGRFETGAYAQAVVRFSDHAEADAVSLYASRPGSRVEAPSLDGPLCVEAEGRRVAWPEPSDPDPEVAQVRAFARAAASGRRAPYGLDAALTALRLADRVRQQLR